MACVLAKRSGITGSLVEARVILQPGAPITNTTVTEIREWCRAQLERYEVPALIRIVTELEMSAAGKISRK